VARKRRTAKGKGRGRKLTPKQKKMLAIAAAVAGAVWIFSRKEPAGGVQVGIELEPIAVEGGQTATAESYRVIEALRPGMTAVPATGSVGGAITFTPSRAGMFTRNVALDENGQILVELK